jgi:hypothetical protein
MWFTEDALTPCAVFGALGLVMLLSGLNSGRRGFVIGGVVLMLIGVSAFAIDHAVVTDREEIETLVRSLCDDFRHKRPGTVEYFSPTAGALRIAVVGAMAMVTIEDEPRLTDFQIKITNQGSRATSHFRANATVNVQGFGNAGHQPSRFILTWSREQNAWKIINVQRMHPYQDKELGLLDQAAG